MILVTGATGFAGRHVVRALVSSGNAVRALVHTPSRAAVITGEDVETAQGDVLYPASLPDAFAGVDAVVHLVAVIRQSRDLTFHRVNYEGTRNVVEAASSAGVKRIVHASTIGATADPSISYLYSRWMAEQEVIRSGISYTVLRFSVGFGEGDEFLNRLAALVKPSPIVPVIGDGKSRFQPIAVEDIAGCVAAAFEDKDKAGKTLELGGPEHFTYEEILDIVAETLNAKIVKVHVPVPLMRPAASLMGAVMSRPPVTSDQIDMLAIDNVTNLDSVEREFGFVPRSLRGNIGYITRMSFADAIKINLGMMPAHIRDH